MHVNGCNSPQRYVIDMNPLSSAHVNCIVTAFLRDKFTRGTRVVGKIISASRLVM